MEQTASPIKTVAAIFPMIIQRRAWFYLWMIAGGMLTGIVTQLMHGSMWGGVSIAVGLCLIPMLFLQPWDAAGSSTERLLKFVLGGTALRVAVAGGGGWLAVTVWPDLPRDWFLYNLLVLYLWSLTWETAYFYQHITMKKKKPAKSA
ncbi:MAG: hypothetical protein KatS3mg113_0519 [Planctomycetaceae bacterium]|nr:MAG: hypothetical protein KatS3mg113_0519 [Planctomycetaceae bacterium]